MNQTEEIQNTEENEDELYEHHRFTIDKGQEPTRIDKFLTIRIVGISRNKIQNAIDAGNVLVNGKPVKANYKTRPLDLVQVVLPNPAWDYTVEPELTVENWRWLCVFSTNQHLFTN
jgi:23S rRNA pseudouridine1911/1915/1917 synthase